MVKTTDHYDDGLSDDDADDGMAVANMTRKGIKCTQCNQVCFQRHHDDYVCINNNV